MIYSKHVGFILQNKIHNTYFVASYKSDSLLPIGGLRFDREESAAYYRSSLDEPFRSQYKVRKLTITTEID